jgi:hypothetical protein
MYRPVFPYKGNQLILTSERVTIHSKTDAIFLFGKQAVSLSSTNTINLDASNKIILAGPVIELGNKAKDLGEPIVLGDTLNRKLLDLLDALSFISTRMAQASTSNPGATAELLQQAGSYLGNKVNELKGQLEPGLSEILSKNTFTR